MELSHFLVWLVFLAEFSYAQWDDDSTQYHISPTQAASDSNTGGLAKPYSSIMEAFDAKIRVSSGQGSGSYCFKLWYSSTPHYLNSEGYSDEFKSLTPAANTIKIHMLSWNSNKNQQGVNNVIIHYMDPKIRWTLSSAWELSFSRVTFRQDKMVQSDWTKELCRHCQYTSMLSANRYTGTGLNWRNLSADEQDIFELGKETSCTNKIIQVTNPGGGLRDTSIDNSTEANRIHYGLVDVAYSGAVLRMQNCLITEFRFRPNYIINSSNGGSIYLTDVDFANIEPSQYGHEDAKSDGLLDYDAQGIITSFQILNARQGVTSGWGWSYTGNVSWSPKPCGDFVWIGGNVTGLNKDVNVMAPYTSGFLPTYRAFMDLRHMRLVQIEDVDFSYNTIPIIDESMTQAIVNIKYWSKVELTRWTFENNMAQWGALYIYYARELWEVETANGTPYNLLSKYTEVITIDSWEFTGNTAFSTTAKVSSGLTIAALNPVNIEIKNSSFLRNNSAMNKEGALVISYEDVTDAELSDHDYTGITEGTNCPQITGGENARASTCWVNQAYADGDNEFFWSTGFYLKLTSNTFDSNQLATVMEVLEWPNVQVTGNTFTNNSDYDYSTAWTGNWATMKKYVDEGRIQKFTETDPDAANPEYTADCSVYGDLYSAQHECEGLITFRKMYGLTINGETQTIQNNSCANGYIMKVSDDYAITFIFENVLFDQNTANGTEGKILEIKHSVIINATTQANTTIPELRDVVFTSNKVGSTSLAGIVWNELNDDVEDDRMRLKVISCTFKYNEAPRGSAIYWTGGALLVNDSVFEGNISTSTAQFFGGAIYFIYALDTRLSNTSLGQFSVSGCTFLNNSGSFHPDICTEDITQNFNSMMRFYIERSTFTGTYASEQTGSIWIGRHSFKQPGAANESYIENVQFAGIYAANGGGTWYFSHLIGAISLTNTTFDSLTSNRSSCGISGDWGTDNSYEDSSLGHTYVELIDSTVTNCDCGYFFYIISPSSRMHVLTQSITVSDNLFTFAYIDHGYFTETGSTFSNNQATTTKAADGSVYYGTSVSTAVFTSSTFTNNSSTKNGGVIYLSVGGTTATFDSISATYNSANKGGFLYAQDQAYFEISNSVISNNSAYKGSAILQIACENSQARLVSNTISNNVGYGCIFLNEAKAFISASTITSNVVGKAEDPSPGMVLIFSEILSQHSTFSNHIGDTGGFLLATSDSKFADTGSTFTDGSANSGGFGYVVNSEVELTRTSINTMYSATAGFLYCINDSVLTMTSVEVSDIYTSYSPALIYNIDTEMNIRSCDFQNFNSTGILVQNSDAPLNIINTNFTNGGGNAVSILGGVLWLREVEQLLITGSRFTNLLALFGGAMIFGGDESDTYTIQNNTFTNCTATQGGAIFNANKKLELHGNFFYNNSAGRSRFSIGDGGAIYSECPTDVTTWISNYTNNTFEWNSAERNGGAIRWLGHEPLNIRQSNTYSNNSAQYGNNYAATAISLAQISSEDYILGNYDEATSTNRILTESLNNLASGQKTGNELILVLRDKYGQAVRTDSDSKCILSGTVDEISLGGTIVKKAESGVYYFGDFSVTAMPGTNATFKISTDGIVETDIGANASIDLDVSMRNCESGEIRQGEGAETQWLKWSESTYAIELNATVWKACLEMATCSGGNAMYPDSGYWRPSMTYDGFYSCLRTESCIGHENYTNLVGACATGYTGNLCQSWEDNYSRTQKNTCDQCTDPDVNGIRIGAMMLVAVIIIIIMVRSTLASANKQKEAYSIYIKIFMNYLQLVVLTASFKLNWPDEVQTLLDSQESAGSVTEQLFSFDCYMMEAYPDTPVFFQKLVLLVLLPVIMITIATMVWGLVAINDWSTKVLKNQLVTTIIVLFFLAHPIIVKIMFSCFAWMEIDGTYYLYEDLDVECFDDTHNFYAFAYALPAMLIWGIACPQVALTLLFWERKDLDEFSVKIKYGFLYIGYRKPVFFWEFVILYRKIAVVFVSVFLASFNIPMQALTATLILLAALYLQEHLEPYETAALNDLEKRSILCSGITIYCGLYFLTDSLSNTGKLGFFFIILTINVYFLTTWILGICFSFAEKGAKTRPYFFRKWCKWWPSIYRAANRVIQREIAQGLNVVPFPPTHTTDHSTQFELEEVNDDIEFYRYIARKRAETGQVTFRSNAKDYDSTARQQGEETVYTINDYDYQFDETQLQNSFWDAESTNTHPLNTLSERN